MCDHPDFEALPPLSICGPREKIMDLHLRGKTILVAGASAGLGYGVAEALAAEGAHLSISSSKAGNIEAAAARLRERYQTDIRGYVCDVTDAAAIQHWVNLTLEVYGTIDGLVVNAGGPTPGKFDTLNDAAWTKAYELTLMSAVRLIRAVLPTMREQRSGAIVTMTSMSVKEPIDILLLSNVFRSGVVSLVKSLSRDLAAEGIRINNLVPGRMDTDRTRSVDKLTAEKRGISLEQQREEQLRLIPMGRYGSAAEFGKAAAFLLSDAASYMTGSTLTVDGGKTQTVW